MTARRAAIGFQGGQVLSLRISEDNLSVTYTLRDSRGNDITKRTVPLNAWGAFDLALKLPPTMNLGQAQVQLAAGLEETLRFVEAR